MSEYGAIVVGSGCAGSWAVKELTEGGVPTLLIEAGYQRDQADIPERFPPGEVAQGLRRIADIELDHDHPGPTEPMSSWVGSQSVQALHPSFLPRGPGLFVDDTLHPYETAPGRPYAWIRGMQLGGRSLTWGGTAMRMSDFEFEDTLSEEAESWPISYDDLAPWYDRVEAEMKITGVPLRSELLPDGVFDSAGSVLSPGEERALTFLRSIGVPGTPVRCVLGARNRQGWPQFTMQATALGAAERTGLMMVRTGTAVERLVLDRARKKVLAVCAVDLRTHERYTLRADTVFVCCGTIESTRLLLDSLDGEANPSRKSPFDRWIGRGLMDHPAVSAVGEVADPGLRDLYEWSARQRGLVIPIESELSNFGVWLTMQRLVREDGTLMGCIDAQGAMAATRSNGVSLSRRTDSWGRRIPRIDCAYGAFESAQYREMVDMIRCIGTSIGLKNIEVANRQSLPGLNVHDLGMLRMGVTADTSFLNSSCQSWDYENLYVSDGSCFPGSGWQNPTLTIMAMSARAGYEAARRTNG